MKIHTEKVQIIEQNGHPAFAVVPYADWLAILGKSDDDNATVPHEVVALIFEKGLSPLAAWRSHLGHSQSDIASALNITQAGVAQIEKPESKPQKRTRVKYAAALGITLEQLDI